jgi:hypothetical protein
MKLYLYGTFPADTPEWFAMELAAVGMDATVVPPWHLERKADRSNPAAFFLKMPPGCTLFRYRHPCQRFEVAIPGELQIGDGRTARVGDTFTADTNAPSGPHTADPRVCTTMEIFSAVEGTFRLLQPDPDGEILEAGARKGELPPEYMPLPGTKTSCRSLTGPGDGADTAVVKQRIQQR